MEYCLDEVKVNVCPALTQRTRFIQYLKVTSWYHPWDSWRRQESQESSASCEFSFQNEDRFTVNNFIDSDNFLMEWGFAAQVAEIVSLFFCAKARLLALGHSDLCTWCIFCMRAHLVGARALTHYIGCDSSARNKGCSFASGVVCMTGQAMGSLVSHIRS